MGVSQLAQAFQKSGISCDSDAEEEDLEKGTKKKDSPAGGHSGMEGTGLDPLVHGKYATLLLPLHLPVFSCLLGFEAVHQIL